ncbi:MAG TPA: HlyC/CorC family transporter [Gammaproteobacteria bacterium]|nr:magnesium and cobalt efflux protein CorC [bacterium BMS3Abin11]HDH15644.1 HlyC/CorC family transporter [Gammaproteobacteria bacterium]HDZ77798.1 HlyC/CorC family transporter [Gammaproteobacteria bacterium]
MSDLSIWVLFVILVVLIACSAFFSSSETAMMALNRYRLKNLADKGHRSAKLASRLLDQPDRLLGVILLGNNLVNLSAASISTIAALRLYGETAIAVFTFILTLIVLVFAEVAPKTLAMRHPEKIAFPASYVLIVLLWVLYPIVWIINIVANRFLRLFNIKPQHNRDALNKDELRTVVSQAESLIPKSHHDMLMSILDLERITVEDIMVPRSAIEGIDLDDEWEEILEQLATSHHTRLPVFKGSLDNVVGVLHLRRVIHAVQANDLDREKLVELLRPAYFVPEDTPVMQQLLIMQKERRRLGLAVDEYGDLQGMITMDEILEEIIGEFNTQVPGDLQDVHKQSDGSYMVNGMASIRDLNRNLGWQLPVNGPKTLNGLILEKLEDIPQTGTTMLIDNYPVEVVQTKGAAVRMVRIYPRVESVVDETDADTSS